MEIYRYAPDEETEQKIRLRSIWNHMKCRCYNPHYHHYHRYGGRGITVCDEWKNSFEEFRKWALSHGYEKDLTIERIDNDKGYNPSNCRFATQREQLRNTSWNRNIEYNGEVHTLTEWSAITGINKSTISSRILRLGWDEQRAITEEVKPYGRRSKKRT